ncbi:hypothetical protein B0H17DRAFT_953379, partial [Mycena rosella]
LTMENTPPVIQKVRKWSRILPLTIPTIPTIAPASAPTSIAPTSASLTSASTNHSSTTPVSAPPILTPLRAAKRTKWDKVDDVLTTYGFQNLGDFLITLFHPHQRGEEDPRTHRHQVAVTRFLQGSSSVKMADLIELIYNHPQSRPKLKHPNEVTAAFSPRKPLEDIHFARPCLSAWATRTVGNETYRRIGRLAKKTTDPDSRTHVRATTNGRTEGAEVVTWDHMNFTIEGLANKYRDADEFLWYITECCAAPREKGKVVIRRRRPHPVIQVGAISSFIVSRNSYANGDLALPLGIWHFACKSHVDVKRVYCRFGSTVSDSTARKALNSMSEASLTMTVESVYNSIDWDHNRKVSNLHISRVLVDFSPLLSHLRTEISARFRQQPIAKHRIRVYKKKLQPLATNAEREVTSQGMQRALWDFDEQLGIDPEKSDKLLSWVRGDGASHATTMKLQELCSVES